MNAKNSFELPAELCAQQPPEARGEGRDDVRLLVIDRKDAIPTHAHFNNLSSFLTRSDLLVFNRSRTLPAAIVGKDLETGTLIEVRLAEHLVDGTWLGLLICAGANEHETFQCGLRRGIRLQFQEDLEAEIYSPDARIPRLWRMRFNMSHAALIERLYRFGKPIRYEYVPKSWPIDFYQNIYATEPGSAEMPSAGRAFTWRLLFDLKKRGIKSTSIVLHTGLSSYLDDALDASHPASEEELVIDETAASAINRARLAGGRIIAIGTTVVRALESACDEQGFIQAQHRYTTLKIDSKHRLRCVDGLITGLHEPEASHLDLLSAFVQSNQLFHAYREAIEKRYLWHEFGDLNLII